MQRWVPATPSHAQNGTRQGLVLTVWIDGASPAQRHDGLSERLIHRIHPSAELGTPWQPVCTTGRVQVTFRTPKATIQKTGAFWATPLPLNLGRRLQLQAHPQHQRHGWIPAGPWRQL